MPDQPTRRPRRWRTLFAVIASSGLALGLSLVGAAPASADPAVTITVDTLAFSADSLPASANPSGCADKETPAKCSLQAALAYANAIPSGAGEILINFDDSLSGEITDTEASAGKMSTTNTNDSLNGGASGATFVVNAANPVTIDFDNRVGYAMTTDWSYNAFRIQSDNVTITNFTNIAAAESAIRIEDVSGTTISNGACNQIDDSSGNNTWNMETCVTLDPDGGVTEDTTISNVALEDPYRTGIYLDSGEHIDGLTVTNTSMVNDAHSPDFLANGSNSVVENVVLSGVSDTVPTGKSAASWAIHNYGGAELTNFTIEGSTFTGMAGAMINDNAAADWSDITITDSTFNKVGQVWDDPIGDIVNFTFTGNTVSNGTTNSPWWRGALHMDQGTYTDATISNNQFIDNDWRDSGDIMFQQPGGSGNVISNNTFVRSQAGDDGYQNAIRNYVVASSATADTGWTVTNNHIDGYGQNNNAYAPIWHLGRGIMKTTGNTFGQNTNGTTDPVQSEGQHKWFLYNGGGGANNRIQTWRPANAVFDGTNVTFDVAPVDPAVGGSASNQPTTPVSLGVFWTADDNAEVYLGQIDGVSGPGLVSIPTTKTGGFIRIQTIQADGTSSQYSGIAEVTTSLAAPVITGPTGGSSGTGGTTIEGTGAPGNTVTVVDQNDGSTVCTAVVDDSGHWSCTPDTLLTQGVHTLVATQSDGTNTSPESDPVNFTSDGTPLFASPEVAVATTAVLGFTVLGGFVLLRRRRTSLAG